MLSTISSCDIWELDFSGTKPWLPPSGLLDTSWTHEWKCSNRTVKCCTSSSSCQLWTSWMISAPHAKVSGCKRSTCLPCQTVKHLTTELEQRLRSCLTSVWGMVSVLSSNPKHVCSAWLLCSLRCHLESGLPSWPTGIVSPSQWCFQSSFVQTLCSLLRHCIPWDLLC